jgi:mRNA interferase MazF
MASQPRRGELWHAEIPHIRSGPVLVLTRDEAIPVLRRVVVAPLTRTIRDIPTEVLVDVDDGVSAPSAISFDNLLTISKALLVSRVATLSHVRMAQVCQALRRAVAC